MSAGSSATRGTIWSCRCVSLPACWGWPACFGYEQGHYEVSQACGERVLFPAVRGTSADDLVVAPGFSCRHQIADFCDNRRSLHTRNCLRWRGEGVASAADT